MNYVSYKNFANSNEYSIPFDKNLKEPCYYFSNKRKIAIPCDSVSKLINISKTKSK
jgi:hypothetical protein